MTWCPWTVHRPLFINYQPGYMTRRLGLVSHVQAGNTSPYGWFSNPAALASSTFWVSKTGVVEQYMDAGVDKSWAQGTGNSSYDSVETEGYPGEPLTTAQASALQRLYLWHHHTFGTPLTWINTPGLGGFGWHGMGGLAWGGHTGCPGDIRKAQMANLVATANTPTPTPTPKPEEQDGTEMLTASDIENGVRNALAVTLEPGHRKAHLSHLELVPIKQTNGSDWVYLVNFDTMAAYKLTTQDALTILTNRGVHRAETRSPDFLRDFTVHNTYSPNAA